MPSKANNNGAAPLAQPPVRMPLWLDELKELRSRSAENELDRQVADPIHEKGLD